MQQQAYNSVVTTLEPLYPPGTCWGCGDPLPKARKKFHNKVCQGSWVGKHKKQNRRRP